MDILISLLVMYVLPALISLWLIRKDIAIRGYENVDTGGALAIVFFPFLNIFFPIIWLVMKIDVERIKKWLFLSKDLRNKE